MTALEAATPKPSLSSSSVSAWEGASVRDRWVFALFAAALLALWLFAHPYAGIIHDARLYVGRALADLDPQGLGQDLLFAHDGQSGFTIYRPLIRAGVIAFGAGPAALAATLVNLCLWFAAVAAWASRHVRGRRLAAVLVAVSILDPSYGGFDVFRYGESFASPRPLAEAAVMVGLALLAGGRLWLAILPLLLAAVIHPVMALPGLAIGFLVHAQRDRRLWLLPVAGVFVAFGAALAHLPVADRLLTRTDPAWTHILEVRTPYLFAGWWRFGDGGRTLIQFAVVALAALGSAGRLRTLLIAILGAAAIGLLATLVFCDGLQDLLALQLQPWRALWPLTVAANGAVPLVTWALWNRGARGRVAAGLLILAWLVCEADLAGLGAAAICLAGMVAVFRGPAEPAPRLVQAVLAIAAVVLAVQTGVAVWAMIKVLALAPPPGSHASLLALWRSGGPTLLILIALTAGAWRLGGRRLPLGSAIAVLALVGIPAVALWDDRSNTQSRIESGEPDRALADALGPEPGGVLWVGGDAQPWLLARRASWATSIQGASVVFSRDLAMTWDDRMQRLIKLGLATEADRQPFTPAKHFARGHAVEASQAICRFADHPAAILLADHKSVPGAVAWAPRPPEMRLMNDGKSLFWRPLTEYTVVRCAALARLPASAFQPAPAAEAAKPASSRPAA